MSSITTFRGFDTPQIVHRQCSWYSEHIVPMISIGKRLRQRAEQLGLSDAEVARRCNLSARRYGNYVTDRRAPDLGTLVEICRVLDMTPNWLLGCEVEDDANDEKSQLLARMMAAGKSLKLKNLRLAVDQVEMLLKHSEYPN